MASVRPQYHHYWATAWTAVAAECWAVTDRGIWLVPCTVRAGLIAWCARVRQDTSTASAEEVKGKTEQRATANYCTVVVVVNCAWQEWAACPTQMTNPSLAVYGHKPVHTTWLRNEGSLAGVGIKTNLDKSLVALILSFCCTVLLLHPTTTLLDFSKWHHWQPCVSHSVRTAFLPAESGQTAGGNTAKKLMRLGTRGRTK